jgi:hypothetical protein
MQSISSLVLLLATVLPSALPQAVASPASGTETATQVYLRFLSVARSAKAMDEITPFWGTALLHEYSLMPDADKPATLDIIKRIESKISDVRVIKETTTPTGVTLTLEGTGNDKKPMAGSVDLVKENGAWKLADQERWTPKAPLPQPNPNHFISFPSQILTRSITSS